MYTVYILRTDKNTLYTGITNDLSLRLHQHRFRTGSKYLKSFSSLKLVYTEIHLSKSAALSREYQIKRLTKSQKEKLISGS